MGIQEWDMHRLSLDGLAAAREYIDAKLKGGDEHG